MNKKLAAALQQYGLTVTGNTAYGIVQGYEISMYAPNPMEQSIYDFHVSFYAPKDKKDVIVTELSRLGLKLAAESTLYGIRISYSTLMTGTLLKNLPALFERLPELLRQYEVPGAECCPCCGKPLDGTQKQRCTINKFSVTLHSDCVSSINQQIEEENRAFANAPNNYIQGICGALIGGVVGAACTIALYYIGFVSSLSAIVAVLLGAFLYRKFGGKPNAMMIVIVSVVSLILIGAAFFVSYLIAAGAAAAEVGLHMSALDALLICLDDSEFASAFYSDLIMLFVFTIVGIALVIASLIKQIKRPKNIN